MIPGTYVRNTYEIHNTYPTLKPRLVAYPTLKQRLVEHTDGRTDFFLGVIVSNTKKGGNKAAVAKTRFFYDIRKFKGAVRSSERPREMFTSKKLEVCHHI